MATVKHFEDLEVWQMARELCADFHKICRVGEFAKDFDLRSQMRRSVGSSMDNIAEGFERNGKKEFVQFLSISKGSIGEFRSQLYRALDNEYISKEQFEMLFGKAQSISVKLNNFISYLTESIYKGTKYKVKENPQTILNA